MSVISYNKGTNTYHVVINKVISMMRGKSPWSDVDMSKKKKFVAAISHSILTKFGTHT